MSYILGIIAKNKITINELTDELPNILKKLLEWIKLIFNYGTLLNNELLFEKLDTNDEFFTQEIRLASLGKEYKNWKILPSLLHESGESWSFEKLVLTSNSGLVDWYFDNLNIDKDKYYAKACENETIQLLGVVYHRLKIILENIYYIIDFLFESKHYGNLKLRHIDNLLLNPKFKTKYAETYELCKRIKEYQSMQETILSNYLNIEKALEKTQIALFNYIKNLSFI